MGRILIVDDLLGAVPPREIVHTGPVSEVLEREWPGGFHRPPAAFWNGARGGDELLEKRLGATDELVLAFCPRGLDPVTIGIIVATIIISVAATFLLMPKVPNPADSQQAGSVYSVGVQANEAKLGAPIPVLYGRVTRTPDYASQSYRWYENNQEVRAFLLCLGAGEMEVDAVRLGETDVTELPPGLVTWTRLRPAEHERRLGAVQTAAGIHENVFTSSDVSNQELLPRKKFQARATASFNGSVVTFQDLSVAQTAKPGDDLVIRKAPANGDFRVVSVSGPRVTIQGSLPVTGPVEFDLAIVANGSHVIGPFISNPPGTRTRAIELDIEWPGGLSDRNSTGDITPAICDLQARLVPVADDGRVIGEGLNFNMRERAATLTPQRRTWRIPVPAGRYRVQLERTDFENRKNQQDRTLWTGLKAYLDIDTASEAYGEVTLLALTVRGAEELSSSAQSRIFATTRTVINRLGTPDRIASANPADVMADLMLNRSGAASASVEGVNIPALEAWRGQNESRSGFNGIFDTRQTLWTALQAVARRGRAEPVMRGGLLSVAVDGPKPVRSGLITADVTIANSLKVQWAFLKDGDPDGIEVEYRDPATFAEQQVRWPEGSLYPKQIKPLGLTDAGEALEEARYLWDDLTRRNAEISFQTSDAANLFNLFDRVGLAAPMFDWGRSVRLVEARGNVLLVSGDVPAGPVMLVMRSPEGEASAIVPATGLPGRLLQLAGPAPVELVTDGAGVPTLIAVSTPAEQVFDLTIRKVAPSGRAFAITAANYVDDMGALPS